MASARNQIIELIERDCIPPEKVNDALSITRVVPGAQSWRVFIDHLLIWLGGLALVFAAMFFVAYNWSDLGRFARFGMMEGLVALAVLAYWKLDKDKVPAKLSQLMASIFLGVLLALYGQTYQTGADPWQLFFNWALLMLPWAIIGRFPAIWILWIVLINLSIVLFHMASRNLLWMMFGSEVDMLWWVFLFNTTALIAWELLENRWIWLAQRWATGLLAVFSGTAVTWLVLYAIFDHREGGAFSIIIWMCWLAGLYFVYRVKNPDLFMLAGGCLSAIVVATGFLGNHLLDFSNAGGFLLLAISIIGLGTGAAIWLRNVHRELQA